MLIISPLQSDVLCLINRKKLKHTEINKARDKSSKPETKAWHSENKQSVSINQLKQKIILQMQFMTKAYEQPFLCTKGYIKNRSCFSGRPRRWTVMKMNFLKKYAGQDSWNEMYKNETKISKIICHIWCPSPFSGINRDHSWFAVVHRTENWHQSSPHLVPMFGGAH